MKLCLKEFMVSTQEDGLKILENILYLPSLRVEDFGFS